MKRRYLVPFSSWSTDYQSHRQVWGTEAFVLHTNTRKNLEQSFGSEQNHKEMIVIQIKIHFNKYKLTKWWFCMWKWMLVILNWNQLPCGNILLSIIHYNTSTVNIHLPYLMWSTLGRFHCIMYQNASSNLSWIHNVLGGIFLVHEVTTNLHPCIIYAFLNNITMSTIYHCNP